MILFEKRTYRSGYKKTSDDGLDSFRHSLEKQNKKKTFKKKNEQVRPSFLRIRTEPKTLIGLDYFGR